MAAMTTTPPPLAAALDLAPHPEGGYYRRYFAADTTVTHPVARSPRPTATLIYYLLPAGRRSAWHTIASDEVWLWRSGGRLRLLVAAPGPGPDTADVTEVLLGPDVGVGDSLDALVPAGHWQCAEPEGSADVLVTCMVSPGFDFTDFALHEPVSGPVSGPESESESGDEAREGRRV
jgi:predicted cupin superfamily sugar epimerase